MPFKPINFNNVKRTEGALAKAPSEQDEQTKKTLAPQTRKEIVESTTERIRIIYDDSGSMSSRVREPGKDPWDESLPQFITLAGEAAEDFMKHCTPHVTAVEIDPLNSEKLELTKNLPVLAREIKAIGASGGTPLYSHLNRLVTDQPTSKFTHAVVFTDGQPDGHCPEGLVDRLLALGIPIDIILIGDYNEAALGYDHTQLKGIADKTKGYFLICKDGKVFKEKLKYFAPTMRWMLPQIASKGN